MIMKILLDAALIALALGSGSLAQACDKGDQKVAKAMGTTVAVYDDKGNYIEDVDAKLVMIDTPIVECKDQPAHVRIKLTDHRAVWVDRLNVQIASAHNAAQTPRKCAAQAVSRPGDTTMPASSGIDPCSQH
jgi:hypothetical protein